MKTKQRVDLYINCPDKYIRRNGQMNTNWYEFIWVFSKYILRITSHLLAWQNFIALTDNVYSK